MMSKVNAIMVTWDPNARKVATAALRAAGLEYLAYETLVEVDTRHALAAATDRGVNQLGAV